MVGVIIGMLMRPSAPAAADVGTSSREARRVRQTYESAGKLPPFNRTLLGADIASLDTLAKVALRVSWRNELIVVCGDASSGGSPNALNTVLQFYALGLDHVLFVSDSAASCHRLAAAVPQLACVFDSRVPRTRPKNGGKCVKMFWDMRFYFYDVRKHVISKLAGELGYNVLQTDTDVAWFASPYPSLKLGTLARAHLIVQRDSPLVNAGVFYVQNVRRGDAAHWVLSELHRRIALFMYHPEVGVLGAMHAACAHLHAVHAAHAVCCLVCGMYQPEAGVLRAMHAAWLCLATCLALPHLTLPYLTLPHLSSPCLTLAHLSSP